MTPRWRHRLAGIGWPRITALALCVLSACAPPERRWVGSIATHGDTTVITTTADPAGGWPAVQSAEVPRPLWGDTALDRPTAVAMLGAGRLVIADRTRLHVLSISGEYLAALGRSGTGPGEFVGVNGIVALAADTLLVWDGSAQRLTWLSAAGRVLRTVTASGWEQFQSPQAVTLRAIGGRVLLAWTMGMIRPNGPPDSAALIETALDGRVLRTLALVEDLSWKPMGSYHGPRYAFGPRAHFAVGPDGRVAYGDGVAYCIGLLNVVNAQPPARLCRRWSQTPIGDARLVPPSVRQEGGSGLDTLVNAQEYGQHRNAFDAILFDEDGRLWVRVVDDTRRYHPFYERRYPEVRPPDYVWEVFDHEGRLTARVALSSRFTPALIQNGTAYGFLENEDGTRSVAVARLPALPGAVAGPKLSRVRRWPRFCAGVGGCVR